MRDTLDRWATTVILVCTITAAVFRRVHRAAARRRLRRQAGAPW